jgi:hypothetical protein
MESLGGITGGGIRKGGCEDIAVFFVKGLI